MNNTNAITVTSEYETKTVMTKNFGEVTYEEIRSFGNGKLFSRRALLGPEYRDGTAPYVYETSGKLAVWQEVAEAIGGKLYRPAGSLWTEIRLYGPY